MIQEQISTSSPKCLDGNAGFGVVAQTAGMAPNVSRDIGMLSGYSHLFPAGDSKNPVAFLHAIRRSGGTDRHVISRVADCGNDYSGRTNRIGHHWIVEESDLPSLPSGPATIASQPNLFCVKWNEKSQELPRGKKLPNPPIAPAVCRTWQQRFGDAGWGGVVAERIEKGDPVSIIFEPGTNPLPLLAEAFALLPPAVRWKTTFSTFFMKSQEPPGAAKIQVKCIVVGSDEMAFARLTPNTLLLDLRNPPSEAPSGKYVGAARTGRAEISMPPAAPGKARPRPVGDASPVPDLEIDDFFELVSTSEVPFSSAPQSSITPPPSTRVPLERRETELRKKRAKSGFPWLLVLIIAVSALLFSMVGVTVLLNRGAIAKRISKNAEIETGDKSDVSEPPKPVSPEPAPEDSVVSDPPKPDKPESSADESDPSKPGKSDGSAIVPETSKPVMSEDPPVDPESSKLTEAEKKAEDKKKADDEKEEQERKAAEEKERKQKAADKAKIAKLPDVWSDIALPRSAGFAPIRLGETSEFLGGIIRDRVKLDLVPFVDLNGEWSHINNKPIKIIKEKHKIVFAEPKQDAFGKPVDAPILRFELNSTGLAYEWNAVQNYNDTEHYQKLNRFLLSKLRIEIDGKTVKEIALWSPLKYDAQQFREAQDRDGFFALWQRRDGKAFAVFPEDKSPMLLDFNEVRRGANRFPVAKPKTFLKSSICYAPKITPINGETGVFTVRSKVETVRSKVETVRSKVEKDEPLKVKVDFMPDRLNDLQQQAKRIKEQIETLRKSKVKDARKTENERDAKLSRVVALERGGPNQPESQKLRAEIKKLDAILAEQNQLDSKIANLNNEYAAKNAELKEEAKKWGDVKIGAFSICLLKPGTTEADAAKPENRLPLFQVGTP